MTILLAVIAVALPACSSQGDNTGGSNPSAAISTLSSSLPSSVLSSNISANHSEDVQTTPTQPSTPPAEPTPISPAPTTAPSPTPSPESAGPPAAAFTAAITNIDDATAARMGTSWHQGCPVKLADLRYLTVTYRGFDGADQQGELVVAATVAADVVEIFRMLYADDYPIASLRLVDDFGGSDDDSMAANNSSAFNCRPVTGGGGFSEHSYGTAIDLDPVQNPYLSGSTVLPDQGRAFADRHPAPGVIEPGDAVVSAFAAHGWSWGGAWSGPIDYQHFSVSGR